MTPEYSQGERLATLETRLEEHEELCSSFRKLCLVILGILVAIMTSFASMTLFMSGRQEVMINALEGQSVRITSIVQGNIERDRQVREDLRSILSDVKELVRDNRK